MSLLVEAHSSISIHSERRCKAKRKHTGHTELPHIHNREQSKTHHKKNVRIKQKTPLQRAFKGRERQHYFTSGSKINESNARDLGKESNPFKYPQDLEEFSFKVLSKAWREKRRTKELTLSVRERPSIRSRQRLDLLERLYVKEPELKDMKTIFDIDQGFFSQVEGRPIPTRLNIRDYVDNVREVLRLRLLAGMRLDEIILVDEMFLGEQREINKIVEEYETYCDAFEQFLFMDHTHSMMLLHESEQQSKITYDKYEHFRLLAFEYGSIKANVNTLEEKWRTLKTYQKFLYQISPLNWRKQHDFLHRKEDVSSQESVCMRERSCVFGKEMENISLDGLISLFMEDIRTQEEPKLYFTEPKQLIKVFTFLALQNLNCLLHTEELALPIENTNEMMLNARKKFDSEIQSIQDLIDSLADGIIWEEERAACLESLAKKLINGPFYKLISDEDALNLYVFVEDVFEMHIAPNDSNLTAHEMMISIESKYEQLLLQLDALPQVAVHKAEMECYALEAKMWKEARDAARKMGQINTLTTNLKRILEPTVIRKYQRLKFRSVLVDPVIPPPPPPRPLTMTESDYLNYFTDFCKHTDKVEAYDIDLSKPCDENIDRLINRYDDSLVNAPIEEEENSRIVN